MTKTQIWNLALAHLGTLSVSLPEENTPEAEACRKHHDNQRRALLRNFDWNFATTEVTLSREVGAQLFTYDYAYRLPDDYLRALKFNTLDAGLNNDRCRMAGQHIHTDDSEGVLEYIRDVEDCSLWDDMFVNGFSYYLAAAIAPQLSKSQQFASGLFAAAQSFMNDAKGADTQETRLKVIKGLNVSPYYLARRGFNGPGIDLVLENGLTIGG